MKTTEAVKNEESNEGETKEKKVKKATKKQEPAKSHLSSVKATMKQKAEALKRKQNKQ